MRKAVASSGKADQVSLVGGAACLDFVNTVEPRVGDQPREYLVTYDDLIAWSRHAGLLVDDAAQRLLADAHARPNDADQILREALRLREACYTAFLAVVRGHEPTGGDLVVLHEAYARAIVNARLVYGETGIRLAWEPDASSLDRPLWPVAASAVDLLTMGDHSRLKDCPTGGDGCGWLFYDTTKNRSRRWCSMRDCGTSAKERRRAGRQALRRPGRHL